MHRSTKKDRPSLIATLRETAGAIRTSADTVTTQAQAIPGTFSTLVAGLLALALVLGLALVLLLTAMIR